MIQKGEIKNDNYCNRKEPDLSEVTLYFIC